MRKLAVSEAHLSEIRRLYKPKGDVTPVEMAFEVKNLLYKGLSDPHFRTNSQEDFEDMKKLLHYCVSTNNFMFLDGRMVKEIGVKANQAFFEHYLPLRYIFRIAPTISIRDAASIIDQWIESPSAATSANLEFLRLAKFEGFASIKHADNIDLLERSLNRDAHKQDIDKGLLIWAIIKMARSKFTINTLALKLVSALEEAFVGRSISEAELIGTQANFSMFTALLKEKQKIDFGRYLLDLAANIKEWREFSAVMGLHIALLCRIHAAAVEGSSNSVTEVLRLLQAHSINFDFYLGTALPTILDECLMYKHKEVLEQALADLSNSQNKDYVKVENLAEDAATRGKGYFSNINLSESSLRLHFATANPLRADYRATSASYVIKNGRAVIDTTAESLEQSPISEAEAKQLTIKLEYLHTLSNIKRSARDREPRRDQEQGQAQGGNKPFLRERNPKQNRGVRRNFSSTVEVKLESEPTEDASTHIDEALEKDKMAQRSDSISKFSSFKGLKEFLDVLMESSSEQTDTIIGEFKNFLDKNQGKELEALDSLVSETEGSKRAVIVITLVLNELLKAGPFSGEILPADKLKGSYTTSSGVFEMNYNKYIVQVRATNEEQIRQQALESTGLLQPPAQPDQ